MMLGPEFGYLQSRIQARHGGRLADAQWRRLAGTSLLGSYLQSIRRTPLEPWVRRLSESTPHHQIELSLRSHWRAYVGALASWPLSGWRPAVAWVDRLVDLPVALELCRGGRIGVWAREDPLYSHWFSAEGVHTDAIAGHLSENIVKVCQQGGQPLAAWRDDWRGRWPTSSDSVRAGLLKLITVVETHLEAMAGGVDMGSSNALRAELMAALGRLFRAYARTPVAIFAHLGLVALDVERLRAALLQRSLYKAEPSS